MALRRSVLGLTAVMAALLAAGSAEAALKPGDHAPDFSAQASLAGNKFTFDLAQARAKGPVVVYFYPAAFTPGCTIEAHEFAEATERFAALGATVIGMSHDPIDTLVKFSTSECRSKFAVGAADDAIIKNWDVGLMLGYTNRTSYVVAPDGTILSSYTAMSPDHHVEESLKAVQAWRDAHPPAP